ncbi:transporter substrate-binding domain-containing protein [Gulosibacter massiliensis]|uniref:transporter substrate-binding domain-containing protein n=1 Tax=Gulosibacter massiliensis TaxID=2479839 RepID=UPI000F643A81|nr:transporter substrate-binding domain-containing protein [Gulosibacter massiliensis]
MVANTTKGHTMPISPSRRRTAAGGRRRAAAYALVPGMLLLSACSGGYPADVDGTLERVREDGLVVGVTEDLPHIDIRDEDRIEGLEAEILTGYAESLGVDVRFEHGSETDMVALLERGEVDIVAGGFPDDTPWSAEAALTRPYGTALDAEGKEERLVFLVKSGENALLVSLETYLHDSGRES